MRLTSGPCHRLACRPHPSLPSDSQYLALSLLQEHFPPPPHPESPSPLPPISFAQQKMQKKKDWSCDFLPSWKHTAAVIGDWKRSRADGSAVLKTSYRGHEIQRNRLYYQIRLIRHLLTSSALTNAYMLSLWEIFFLLKNVSHFMCFHFRNLNEFYLLLQMFSFK